MSIVTVFIALVAKSQDPLSKSTSSALRFGVKGLGVGVLSLVSSRTFVEQACRLSHPVTYPVRAWIDFPNMEN